MFDPDEFRVVLEEHAKRHDVLPFVHKQDFIFQFLMGNQSFPTQNEAIAYYFSDAARSAEKLIELVSRFVIGDTHPVRLLEFASGYGCVSRHLKKHKELQVLSCDIHSEAIKFISQKLGLAAMASAHSPADFCSDQRFDVIFALSFFSHMPHQTWAKWLQALLNQLVPEGILIFTTHGRQSIKWFGSVAIDKKGFWFRKDSEQKDLDVEEYGQTIALPKYVFSELAAVPDAAPAFFQEAYWWGHQDTYVVRKTAVDGVCIA